MNQKSVFWALGFVGILALGLTIFMNPLRWPEGQIQKRVLRKAPMGSSIADVEALIKREKWDSSYEWQGPDSDEPRDDFP